MNSPYLYLILSPFGDAKSARANAYLPIGSLAESICIVCHMGLYHLPEGILSFFRWVCIIFQVGLYHLPEGILSFARRYLIICQKGSYHLPEGILSFARRDILICQKVSYHLPEGVISFARRDFSCCQRKLYNIVCVSTFPESRISHPVIVVGSSGGLLNPNIHASVL